MREEHGNPDIRGCQAIEQMLFWNPGRFYLLRNGWLR